MSADYSLLGFKWLCLDAVAGFGSSLTGAVCKVYEKEG